MNLKKFISGVSAFAIAASAFAAMAVTASATDYEDVAVTPGTLVRAADSGDGTFRTANNTSSGVSAVVADLSGLEGIASASTVTVEFNAKVPASGGAFGKLVYGIGDKEVRGLTGNNSSAGNYKTTGLAAYFGSLDGSKFQSSNKSGSYNASQVGNKDLHVTVTLDRDADTYSYVIELVGTSMKLTQSGETDVDNLTVIEAFTWGTQAYDLTFSDITVSYTVPDAPVEPVVSSEVVAAQAFTTPDYDENMVVGVISLNVSGAAIDLADATYQGQTGTVDGDTSFEGEALINVVITGATSTAALNDVVFN